MKNLKDIILEKFKINKNTKINQFNFKGYNESLLDQEFTDLNKLKYYLREYFKEGHYSISTSKDIDPNNKRLTYNHQSILIKNWFRLSFYNENDNNIQNRLLIGETNHGVVMQLQVRTSKGTLENCQIIGQTSPYNLGNNFLKWLYQIKDDTEKNKFNGDINTMIFFGLME